MDMLGKAMRDYAARVLFKASGRGEELPTLYQNKIRIVSKIEDLKILEKKSTFHAIVCWMISQP